MNDKKEPYFKLRGNENASFRERLHQLDNQQKLLREKRDQLISQWIKAESPHQLGDIIEVTGFAHQGKKMVVEGIWIREKFMHDGSYEFVYTGTVLKKDGTKGQRRGRSRAPCQ